MKRRGFLGALVGGAAAIATPIAVKKTLLLPESAVDSVKDVESVSLVPQEELEKIRYDITDNHCIMGVSSVMIQCSNCDAQMELSGYFTHGEGEDAYRMCGCGHLYRMRSVCEHITAEDWGCRTQEEDFSARYSRVQQERRWRA